MRRHPAATATAAAGALCLASLAGIGVAAAGTGHPAVHAKNPWGTAIEVPGTAALNVGGLAGVSAVSCSSTGNCSAGGNYGSTAVTVGKPPLQAFVATETNGTWGNAIEVPGIAALNVAGVANVTAMSCTSPGNCSAGGFYAPSDVSPHLPNLDAFVVDETNGTWGTAKEVPGTAALNQGGSAEILSISCLSPGNCSAGGFYSSSIDLTNGIFTKQAFVVTETNGTWGTAIEVPGTAALNKGGSAGINSLSCSSVGNCSAGGFYGSSVVDGVPTTQAMVVTETSGTWGTAQEVPGTAALNTGIGAYATVNAVSCASAGNCSAGGEYLGSSNATEAFVVTETGGTWGTAQEVPGIETLNSRALAQVDSMACVSPGNCDAGGFYQDASFVSQAFVVTETGGTWGTAQELPGTATLNRGHGGADVPAISCDAAGSCGAGGWYQGSANVFHAFVDSKTNGVWNNATEVPGALSSGVGAQTQSAACAATGYCGAGGYFTDISKKVQAFVVNGMIP
jgi:hypothetical protein